MKRLGCDGARLPAVLNTCITQPGVIDKEIDTWLYILEEEVVLQNWYILNSKNEAVCIQ